MKERDRTHVGAGTGSRARAGVGRRGGPDRELTRVRQDVGGIPDGEWNPVAGTWLGRPGCRTYSGADSRCDRLDRGGVRRAEIPYPYITSVACAVTAYLGVRGGRFRAATSAREGLNNPHLGRNAIGCGSKIRFEDLSER